MKLLFDQNLSLKLCQCLVDLFPDAAQVRKLGLDRADDRALWHYAKINGFVIVTHDSDFAHMAALYGPPPKIIWLRCGNRPTDAIETLLRNHAEAIDGFGADKEMACLEIF